MERDNLTLEKSEKESGISRPTEETPIPHQLSEIGIWEQDLKTGKVNFSEKICSLLGLDNRGSEIDFESALNIIHPHDRHKFVNATETILKSGQPQNLELRISRADGEERVHRIHIEVFNDSEGNPARLVGTGQDITEYRKLAEELKESEARNITKRKEAEHSLKRQNEIVANMREGVHLVQADNGKIVYTNPRFDQMFGYDQGELIGEKVSILNAPCDKSPEEVSTEIIKTLKKQGSWKGEIKNVRKFGSTLWTNTTVTEYEDSQFGKVWLSVKEDITERKRAEDALRESEARFRMVVENAPDRIAVHDLEGRFLAVNKNTCESLGYSEKELLTMSVFDTEKGEVSKDLLEIWRELTPDKPFQLEGVHHDKDGRETPVDVRLCRVEWDGRPAILGVARDITEYKLAEKALSDSERRLRRLFEQAGDGIIIYDLEGQILDANIKACKSLGYSHEEMVLLNLSHIEIPSDNTDLEISNMDFPPYHTILREGTAMCKDGSAFPVEVRAGLIQWKNSQAMLAHVRDITERKQTEQELKGALAEKEVLIKEIHHRVKNNMQIISSLLKLQAQKTDNETVMELLNESQGRVKAMALIHEALYQSENLEAIDLMRYLSRLADNLYQVHGTDKERIRLKLSEEFIPIAIDRAPALGLAINELLSNSLKYAFPDNGEGEIRIEAHLKPEHEIEMVISDNGIGLDDGIGFDSKETLGLGLVAGLVEKQLHGSISIEKSKGAKFRLVCKGV